MFSNVLLLGQGGRTVFAGRSEDALKYFSHVGFAMPPLLNPADFFMDCIAGKHRNDNSAGKADPKLLFELWERHRGAYENGILFFSGSNASLSTVGPGLAQGWGKNARPIDPCQYALLKPAGFWRALGVNIKRAATQHTRTMSLNFYDVFLHTGTGIFIGAANGIVDLSGVPQAALMYSLGLGMTVGLASLRVFGNERIVFWRESAPGSGMGLSPLPYFVAKNVVEVPRIILLVFCEAGGIYPWIQTFCGFWEFVFISIFAAWHISGWAMLLSISFDDKSAQLILVILCLANMLYAGVQTKLSDMSQGEYAFSWVSQNRWLVEDMYNCHADGLSVVFGLPPQWYDNPGTSSSLAMLLTFNFARSWNFNSRLSPIQWNVLMNFWFGILSRVLSFLALLFCNRAQMFQQSIFEEALGVVGDMVRVFFPQLHFESSAQSCIRSVKEHKKKLWHKIVGKHQTWETDESPFDFTGPRDGFKVVPETIIEVRRNRSVSIDRGMPHIH